MIRALFFSLIIMTSWLLMSCSNLTCVWNFIANFGGKPYGCRDFQSIKTPLGDFFNNVWNKQAAGAYNWSQCFAETKVDGKHHYTWSWSWPLTGDTVLAYPGMIVGAKPWSPGPGNDQRFPRRIIDTKKMMVSYDIETQANGAHNLAASIWLIRTPAVANPPVPSAIATEIMIWTESTPATFVPGGHKRGEVRLNDTRWEIWVAKNWGDVSGRNPNRWTYIAYRAKTPMRTIRYDAKEFINDAIRRGLVNPDLYIADVELGNEILNGSGKTRLKSFSVSIN